MWSITQRYNELQTHNQDTSITQDNEDVFAHIVTKRIKLLIRQGTSNEVEGEIEIGLDRLAGMNPKRNKINEKLTRPK